MTDKNNREQQAEEQPVPETQQRQQGRPCPKDCRKCSMAQQICCASMLSFQMYDVLSTVIQRLDMQSQRLYGVETRLTEIRSSETELSSPLPFQESI